MRAAVSFIPIFKLVILSLRWLNIKVLYRVVSNVWRRATARLRGLQTWCEGRKITQHSKCWLSHPGQTWEQGLCPGARGDGAGQLQTDPCLRMGSARTVQGDAGAGGSARPFALARLLVQRCAGSCRVPTALLPLARPRSRSFPISHLSAFIPISLCVEPGQPRGCGATGQTPVGVSPAQDTVPTAVDASPERSGVSLVCHPQPSGGTDSCRDSGHGSIHGQYHTQKTLFPGRLLPFMVKFSA